MITIGLCFRGKTSFMIRKDLEDKYFLSIGRLNTMINYRVRFADLYQEKLCQLKIARDQKETFPSWVRFISHSNDQQKPSFRRQKKNQKYFSRLNFVRLRLKERCVKAAVLKFCSSRLRCLLKLFDRDLA